MGKDATPARYQKTRYFNFKVTVTKGDSRLIPSKHYKIFGKQHSIAQQRLFCDQFLAIKPITTKEWKELWIGITTLYYTHKTFLSTSSSKETSRGVAVSGKIRSHVKPEFDLL